jgi:hypothetical protein
MFAKCPKCEKVLTGLRITPIIGTADNGSEWNCLAFSCPSCNTAIGADIDLTAVRSDLLNAIEALKQRR